MRGSESIDGHNRARARAEKMMILLKIEISVPLEKQKEFCQTASALARQIRKEEGCISHNWYHDLDNQETFLLIEQWDTNDHITTHLQSEQFGILSGALKTLGDQQSIQIKLISEGGGKNGPKGVDLAMRRLTSDRCASSA